MATLDETISAGQTGHISDHQTLHGLNNLPNAKGDLPTATAADTWARLPVGSDGQVLTAASGQSTGLQWATPSGTTSALLAVKSYNPGSLATYTTGSATSVDVDATNLAVAFTVPASGTVLVRLVALGNAGGPTVQMNWDVRESTTVVSDQQQIATAADNRRYSAAFYITGLTPAASKTYKWGWRQSGAGTLTMYAGGVAGAMVMEVWAGP